MVLIENLIYVVAIIFVLFIISITWYKQTRNRAPLKKILDVITRALGIVLIILLVWLTIWLIILYSPI